jgi:hypothetical protein
LQQEIDPTEETDSSLETSIMCQDTDKFLEILSELEHADLFNFIGTSATDTSNNDKLPSLSSITELGRYERLMTSIKKWKRQGIITEGGADNPEMTDDEAERPIARRRQNDNKTEVEIHRLPCLNSEHSSVKSSTVGSTGVAP